MFFSALKKIARPLIMFALIFSTIFLLIFNVKNLLPPPPKLQVIGFLPYWNLTDELKVDFDLVDQLIYFNLTVNEKGEFITDRNEGDANGLYHLETNPQLKELLNQGRRKNKKILLCVASFNAGVMYKIVSDPDISNNLIQNIIEKVKEKKFDGVDMDFEYFWQYNHEKTFGRNFNAFLTELRTAMDKIDPKLILSVDIYPKAIIEDRPYILKEMNEIIDQLIIMAYDYTQSGSDQAGPISPIRTDLSLDIKENYSIVQTLKSTEGKIDKEKVILGIPLYGYKWRTYDDKHRSKTYPGLGEMISYSKMKKLLEQKDLAVNWDDNASSPWLVSIENGNIFQIYFENLESLKLKFQLSQEYNLPGIAFWALGYEGKSKEIWEYLKEN